MMKTVTVKHRMSILTGDITVSLDGKLTPVIRWLFTNGQCHALAVALHELLGWRIVVAINGRGEDAAAQVAEGVKAKASGLYQTLDNLSGGQAQRFRDAAKNISDKLGEIVGLDDDKEAQLLQKQADIETAHKAMLDKLAKQGVDPDTLARADAAWKRQAALTDLSNAIRQSTGGLRPELVQAGTKATPETVNPKVLFTKLNRLNDRGRLAQAIGQDHADALLQHIDAAYVSAQKIAQKQKWAGVLAKYGGLGAAAEGVHLAHELLGGSQQ